MIPHPSATEGEAQVIKRILPAMGNEIITLVKDTSLPFVLGIMEMFSAAKAA